MSSGSRRSWLNQAAVSGEMATNVVDSRVAMKESVTFAFVHYFDCLGKFSCAKINSMNFKEITTVFRLYSSTDRNTIFTSYPHCHVIEGADAISKGLADLVKKSPNGKLFQLGRRAEKERIIGFFESSKPNLFQVGLIDLNHEFYPTHR